MLDFNFSSVKELKSLLKDKLWEDFTLCGQNSFEASEQANYLDLLKDKELKILKKNLLTLN